MQEAYLKIDLQVGHVSQNVDTSAPVSWTKRKKEACRRMEPKLYLFTETESGHALHAFA